MKPNHAGREVLLFINTTFSHKQFCRKENDGHPSKTRREQLEEACWEGVLPELLPEVVTYTLCNKKIFTWQIIPGNSFLYITYGDVPIQMDNWYSINPHGFIYIQPYN